VIISGQLRAQGSVPQITFGGGGGLATAFAGSQLQKTTTVFYGDAAFYPVAYFNVNIEAQTGVLSGRSLNKKNTKSFDNNYQAVIINGELQARIIIAPDINGFFDVVRNIYVGAGYGLMRGDITYVSLIKPNPIAHIKNTLRVVPFKAGYELNIVKNNYNEPVLKLDGCLSLNYVNGKGIDGYYNKNAASFSFYSYCSLGLRYVISLRHGRARDYNKFD